MLVSVSLLMWGVSRADNANLTASPTSGFAPFDTTLDNTCNFSFPKFSWTRAGAQYRRAGSTGGWINLPIDFEGPQASGSELIVKFRFNTSFLSYDFRFIDYGDYVYTGTGWTLVSNTVTVSS